MDKGKEVLAANSDIIKQVLDAQKKRFEDGAYIIVKVEPSK